MSLETKRYATMEIAQTVATKCSRREKLGIAPYHCQFCGHYHIGKKEFAPPPYCAEDFARAEEAHNPIVEVIPMSDPSLYFVHHEGVKLAKIIDPIKNRYVFAVPEDIQPEAVEVLEHGKLLAWKDGKGPYLDSTGKISPHWKAYNPIPSMLIPSAMSTVTLYQMLGNHKDNMIPYPQVKPTPDKVCKPLTAGGHIDYHAIHFSEKNGVWFYKGIELKREGSLKSFTLYRDVECHKGCGKLIPLKARVTEKDGKPTFVAASKPLVPATPIKRKSSIWHHTDCASAPRGPRRLVVAAPVEKSKPIAAGNLKSVGDGQQIQEFLAKKRVATEARRKELAQVDIAFLLKVLEPSNGHSDTMARGIAFGYISKLKTEGGE